MTIREYWREHFLLFDGGMGTLLQQGGMPEGESPLRMNLLDPKLVRSIHRAYYEAGSNIATTNTFGLNTLLFSREEAEKMTRAAVENAKAAREEANAPQEKYIALDIGPTGRMMAPLGDLAFEDAVEAFAAVIRIGAAEGVDCVLIETMNDCLETKAAVLAAKENCTLPVLVTNAYSADGRLLSGTSPEAMCAMLEGLGADTLGANCSLGPGQLAPVMDALLTRASVPLLCQPNAGMPRVENGKTVYDITPEEFADAMLALAKKGVRMLGGCCGTTPEYIRLVAERIQGLSPALISEKHLSVVSSAAVSVDFGQRPVIIGERINPTGKKRFQQALREGDLDYVIAEGVKEEEAGAEILDVNVGMPGADEKTLLPLVTAELQAVSRLPLQLDTASPGAMEAAMRGYAGKPLLNSVNGSEESMKAVFPLMKKYGAMAVALTLDENGIPSSAEERAAIAEKILRGAEKYGLGKKDFLFDPLTMSVSADPMAAEVTLKALGLLREMGCLTVLGVSNVSFGLPGREALNSMFFAMAMEKGLNAAILNPNSAKMMETWRSFLALKGQDPHFEGYIAQMAREASASPLEEAPADPEEELRRTILHGRRDQAEKLAASLLKKMEPADLAEKCVIPALDAAGQEYQAGRLFLPQLLMCAEAAKQAFASVRGTAVRGGKPVILATVRGDVHDIGKNIVALLLENYGFSVLDLGKDVPPERILAAAQESGAPLVGLSALMTTTVPAMEETIALLKEKLPGCRVCVGGAVLTREYAERIGADAYCASALDTVRYAEKIFG